MGQQFEFQSLVNGVPLVGQTTTPFELDCLVLLLH